MFKLNFKIALRNIWKNKTSSFINISGLAIGLASCLLLLLYVSYEWSFDRQGKDSASVYKVLTNSIGVNGEIIRTGSNTGNIIGPVIKETYPNIEAVSRVDYNNLSLIANGTKSFKKNSRFADPDIFKIFDYTFIAGEANTAFSAPDNVVLTESMAMLLFGTTDALNRVIKFDNKVDLKVTGVIKDLPENISVDFDYLLPWSLLEQLSPWIKSPQWTNFNWTTLVKLSPAANSEQINKSLKGLMERHEPGSKCEPFLYPLSKVHLYGDFNNGISTGGEIQQVRLFMGLALGILLIACVNFMNMATAKSERRAKEVGIKKTIGASRGSLVSQFMMESLILTFCSAIMAIVIIEVCLPLFNNLLEIELVIDYSNAYVWISLISIILITGFVAGSYPAFYLSSFNPIQILKKKNTSRGLLSINLRQVLVVGQFSFAVILIIATTVIYKQIQFIKNRPVGYQINELIEMPQDGNLSTKFELLKEKLLQSGAVNAVNQASTSLSHDGSSFYGMEWPGSTEADKMFNFDQIATTYDFIKTTGLTLTAGRDFSRDFASDSTAVMLSESAIKRMNLVNPIGQIVKYHGVNSTIVGVFKDFIWGAPSHAERPMLVAFNKGWSGTINMRLNTANAAADNVAIIQKIVKELNPAYPVEINYVDQLYAKKLKSEKVLGILSNLFGGLAIFISCLGLFGLAAYSAEQRTKEIGVRKVLGASVASLMQLLSFSFLKMVLFAIVISIPVASYIMGNWLDSFELHTEISWLIILLSAIGTIGIAILTVSFQAYRAAKANPVNSLKYE